MRPLRARIHQLPLFQVRREPPRSQAARKPGRQRHLYMIRATSIIASHLLSGSSLFKRAAPIMIGRAKIEPRAWPQVEPSRADSSRAPSFCPPGRRDDCCLFLVCQSVLPARVFPENRRRREAQQILIIQQAARSDYATLSGRLISRPPGRPPASQLVHLRVTMTAAAAAAAAAGELTSATRKSCIQQASQRPRCAPLSVRCRSIDLGAPASRNSNELTDYPLSAPESGISKLVSRWLDSKPVSRPT